MSQFMFPKTEDRNIYILICNIFAEVLADIVCLNGMKLNGKIKPSVKYVTFPVVSVEICWTEKNISEIGYNIDTDTATLKKIQYNYN